MVKRLFVHLGTAKTGTTSIQGWMLDNDAALRKVGILYPRIQHEGDQSPSFNQAHHILAFHWGQGWAKYDRGITEAAWNNFFAAARAWPEDVVISSETFALVVAEHGGDFFEFIASNLPGIEIVPVVYLREHTDFLRSDAMERLRNSQVGTSVFEHAINMPWYVRLIVDYQRLVANMMAHPAVSRRVIRPFEPGQFEGGNLVSDFLAAIGCEALHPGASKQTANQFNDTNAMRHLLQAIGAQPFTKPREIKHKCYRIAQHRRDKSGAFRWPRDFGEFLFARHEGDRAFLASIAGTEFFRAAPRFAEAPYRSGRLENRIAATLYRELTGERPGRGDFHTLIERLALRDAIGRLKP